MAISEEERKNGLARIQGALAKPKARAMIAEVLPAVAKKYLTPERIATVVFAAASRNPLLAVCTPASVVKAVMEVAPLGLEIGGPLGHVYLVPFYNKYIGAHEAVPIPGYMGYVALAYRTGEVQSICADAIYKGDNFKHVRHEDRDEFLHERMNKTQEIIGFYCRAIYKKGGCHIERMFTDEVDKIRQRSRARDAGPWTTDYVPMGKKTTVRQARKFWPQSWEIAKLVDLDNRVDTGEYIDANRVIEAVPTEAEKPATDALADRISGALPNGEEPAGEPQGAPQPAAGAAITGATSGATAEVTGNEPPFLPDDPETSKGQTPEEVKKSSACREAFIRWCDGDEVLAGKKLKEATGSDDYRQLTGQILDDLHRKVQAKIEKEMKDNEIPF